MEIFHNSDYGSEMDYGSQAMVDSIGSHFFTSSLLRTTGRYGLKLKLRNPSQRKDTKNTLHNHMRQLIHKCTFVVKEVTVEFK